MTPQVKSDEGPREKHALSSAEEHSLPSPAPSWPEPRSQGIPQVLEEAPLSSKPPIVGVLLIHGINGNSSDLEELATFLQEQGLITMVMRLPGHGEHGCAHELRNEVVAGSKSTEKCVSLMRKYKSILIKEIYMNSIADGSVIVQTSSQSVPATPPWFGEVALMAQHLRRHDILSAICEHVRFARRLIAPLRRD